MRWSPPGVMPLSREHSQRAYRGRRRRQENTSQRARGDGQVVGPESTVFLVFFQIKGYRL